FCVVQESRLISFCGRDIPFDVERDIIFDLDQMLPGHSNAMRFEAFDCHGGLLAAETWYSVGGGFIVRDGEEANAATDSGASVPFPYRNAAELLMFGERNKIHIADVVHRNEIAMRPASDVFAGIDRIATVMFECIERGMQATGELPGALKVRRRANSLFERL